MAGSSPIINATGGVRVDEVEVRKQEKVTAASQPVIETPKAVSSAEKLRTDLMQLLKVGQIEEEFEVMEGLKLTMSTLIASKNTEVLAAIADIKDDDTRFSQMRYEVLARSIKSVNGTPIDLLYQETPEQDRVAEKIRLISSWQQVFVNRLWAKYDDMVIRSQAVTDKIGGDSLKK